MPEEAEVPVGTGVGRRAMIKRAAAAGAVAWTAPLIIDSLASPAAAATYPTLCYNAQFNDACSRAGAVTNTCAPSGGWSSLTGYPGTITTSAACSTGSTFTLAASDNCVFVNGALERSNGCDATVTAAPNSKTITLTRVGNGTTKGYRLTISCGGASC